jgi:hypothetical protein
MFKAVMMTIAQEFTHHWGILHVYLLQKKCCIMITAYTATDGRVDNSTSIDEENSRHRLELPNSRTFSSVDDVPNSFNNEKSVAITRIPKLHTS